MKWKDWILLSKTIRYNCLTALDFPESSLPSICCTSSLLVHSFSSITFYFQTCEWETIASLALLNTAQNSVITAGLLAGTLYCGKLVGEGQLQVSTTQIACYLNLVMWLEYFKCIGHTSLNYVSLHSLGVYPLSL